MAEHTPGMTLRDHLAARAQRAYAMADAMLEARNALRAELERACGRQP